MLRIRLTRVGKKKQPSYRIVVADSRAPRDGAFLKIIGHYNPRTEPMTLDVKEDEALYWLQHGAQPSETAAKLLTRLGIIEKAGRAPALHQGKEVPPAAGGKKGQEAPILTSTASAASLPSEAEAAASEAAAEPAAEE